MESYHKKKKLLDEKYCKLIKLKPYNDDIDIGTVDNSTENR